MIEWDVVLRNMAKHKFRILLITILMGVTLFFLIEKDFLPGITSRVSPHKDFELLGTVIRLIKNDYIVEKDPAETMEGAFKGLVNSLDILSGYLDKEQFLKYTQQRKPGLPDTGIIIVKRPGLFPQVVGVRENSPAESRGIRIGDYISTVDNQSTLMMSAGEVYLHLKGYEDSPVALRILRGNTTHEMNVGKALFHPETYSFSAAENSSGILQLHSLFPPAAHEIRKKALLNLKQERGPLILDLRNCHEGEIEEARKIINLFLKAEKIGHFASKGQSLEVFSCPDTAPLDKIPLFVWVNQATIGPAEMIAAVLKEFGRARVIGQPTPGMVAKQEIFPLGDRSGIILTSGVFTLTSGEKLWGKGVSPDVHLDPQEQTFDSYLQKTLKLLSSS